MYRLVSALLALSVVSGCASVRETQPPTTANEQLLISRAADEAAAQIDPTVATASRIFIDTRHFKSENDTHYAVSAITTRLLEAGYEIVPSRSEAESIATLRTGALSINKKEQLWFGIPSVTVPIPLAGPFETPGLDLFKTVERTGVAKFGVTFRDARTGALQDSIGPIYGFSHHNRRKILMMGWSSSDLIPAEAEARDDH